MIEDTPTIQLYSLKWGWNKLCHLQNNLMRFSNAVLHWIKTGKGVASIWRSLKQGAFVAKFGGKEIKAIVAAIYNAMQAADYLPMKN